MYFYDCHFNATPISHGECANTRVQKTNKNGYAMKMAIHCRTVQCGMRHMLPWNRSPVCLGVQSCVSSVGCWIWYPMAKVPFKDKWQRMHADSRGLLASVWWMHWGNHKLMAGPMIHRGNNESDTNSTMQHCSLYSASWNRWADETAVYLN